MVVGEPVALLVTITVPLKIPWELGAKITLKARVCPGVSMTGVPAPLRVNPAPLSEIWEIVTLAFPVLVTVTLCVEDDPVFTLAKSKTAVLKESTCVADTPVPLRAIRAGEFGALLTIVTLPLAVPAEAGANWTLKVVDRPALRVMGRDRVLRLKPPPVTLTCENVSAPVPLLVNLMVCVLGEPTVTSPKLTLEGVRFTAG